MTRSRKFLPARMAAAIAMASVFALTATAIEAPAAAQKKKKKKDEAKPQISQEFIAAYKPIEDVFKAEGGDLSTVTPQIPAMAALAVSPDEKMAAGGMIYNIGVKTSDSALQRQGVGMMLSSGKVPAENLGQYNMLAGQLAFQDKDYPAARQYILDAIANGFTDGNPAILVAESYFAEDQAQSGLQYLSGEIDAKIAAGEVPPEEWLRRGLAVAYRADLAEESRKFAYLYAKNHPSEASWGDAIVIVRNFGSYTDAQILDLSRLQRRTGTFRQPQQFVEYIEAADPRRLPGEVKALIDEGYASGVLPRDHLYAQEAYSIAEARIRADKSDLPALEKDANSSSASLRTIVAAGDAFLNYDQPAKAEAFYRRALDMQGADTEMLLNRIGIAQVDQGNYEGAQETFGRIAGARKAIAQLWSAYAAQQVAPEAAAVATAPTG